MQRRKRPADGGGSQGGSQGSQEPPAPHKSPRRQGASASQAQSQSQTASPHGGADRSDRARRSREDDAQAPVRRHSTSGDLLSLSLSPTPNPNPNPNPDPNPSQAAKAAKGGKATTRIPAGARGEQMSPIDREESEEVRLP